MNRDIKTKEEFKSFTEQFQKDNKLPFAYALGIPYYSSNGKIIAARFTTVNVEKNLGFMSALMHFFKKKEFTEIETIEFTSNKSSSFLLSYFKPFKGESGHDNLVLLSKGIPRIILIIYPTKEHLTQQKPINNIDALCRLTMLSRLEFKPRELNLDNIFDVLEKVYFTRNGAISESDYKSDFIKGNLHEVINVDKFPPILWGTYLPEGVRVANPSMVRLGAYLSPGTTVMNGGFVNFNAGTLGKAMIEGRISAGVIVGKNSDIGGGASTMGTLSGGGKEKISIGENCLLGANAGIGISLGNGCTVEAGLYVTAGLKVKIKTKKFKGFRNGRIVKALELSGKDYLLFRRNSRTGEIEVLYNEKVAKLNDKLHA